MEPLWSPVVAIAAKRGPGHAWPVASIHWASFFADGYSSTLKLEESAVMAKRNYGVVSRRARAVSGDEWLVGHRYLSNHSLEAILDSETKDNNREETRELTAA
jgi:hypothetical protein